MRRNLTLWLILLLLPASARDAAAQTTLIRNARVFDGEQVIEATDVLVRDGVIAAIGSGIAAPPGATLVDGSGRTLLPGLIDAHVHVFGEMARAALAFGVTTELDMFTNAELAAGLRAEQAAGRAAGRADVFSAGTLVTAPGGHGTEYIPIPTLSSADSAQAFVDARIAEGSAWIKIVYDDGATYGLDWPTLDRATLRAVIDAAHRRGRLAIVHVGSAAGARTAIEEGADGLAHGFTDAMPDDDFAALVAESGAFVIPTLSVLRSIAGTAPGSELAADSALAPYLTIAQRAALRQAFPMLPGAGHRDYEVARGTVRALRAAGVPLLAGTDAPNPGTWHGVSLHGELVLLVDAGLSPTEALAAATSRPARIFGLTDRGRIAEGLRADLLLVHGDPTRDIRATRRIDAVWKGGVRFDRAAFREEIATQIAAQQVPLDTGDGAISTFDDGTMDARFGMAWMPTTDSVAGGGSSVRAAVVDEGPDARSLHVEGEISPLVPYAWAGVMWSPGDQPMQPRNLSASDGVAFRTRGDGGRYRLAVFAHSAGMTLLSATFEATAHWTQVTVPWSELGTDGSDVMSVMFLGGPGEGPFTFEVDDVELY